jgi:hypothetical protein
MPEILFTNFKNNTQISVNYRLTLEDYFKFISEQAEDKAIIQAKTNVTRNGLRNLFGQGFSTPVNIFTDGLFYSQRLSAGQTRYAKEMYPDELCYFIIRHLNIFNPTYLAWTGLRPALGKDRSPYYLQSKLNAAGLRDILNRTKISNTRLKCATYPWY